MVNLVIGFVRDTFEFMKKRNFLRQIEKSLARRERLLSKARAEGYAAKKLMELYNERFER